MLEEALRAAVRQGYLLLPTRGVDGLIRIDGDIIRYDEDAPDELVARAMWSEITRRGSPKTDT